MIGGSGSVAKRADSSGADMRCLTPLSTRGYGMEAKPECSNRRRDLHG